MIKINFVDFWDNFCKTDNYFFNLLSTRYKVTIDEENPDFLFFSIFGNKHKNYTSKKCKKIFFTGENIRPNLYFPSEIVYKNYSIGKCDFSFSFDDTQDQRNYRLPLWVLYINWFNSKKDDNRDISYLINPHELFDRKITLKNKFCNFVFSNNQGRRLEILNAISKYKNVDCAGKLSNNVEMIRGRGDQKYKIDFIKNYKFTIAAENSKTNGYTTEKILHPLSVGSIPIYWGSSSICEDFNKNCFINVDDFDNLEELVEYIIKVDKEDYLYEKIVTSPIFLNNEIPLFAKPESVLKFIEEKIIC